MPRPPNLTRFYPLVHSCSNDRTWAIGFVAARIDFIFVLSDRSKANFPADPQSKRAKQQKALTGGQSLLALTDQDEAWGKWKPSDSRSSKDLSSLILSLSNRRKLSPARLVQLKPLPAKAENSSFAVFIGSQLIAAGSICDHLQ